MICCPGKTDPSKSTAGSAVPVRFPRAVPKSAGSGLSRSSPRATDLVLPSGQCELAIQRDGFNEAWAHMLAIQLDFCVPWGHGPWGHGPWGHGPWGHGPWGHGPWGHGPWGHGPWGHGPRATGHGPRATGHGPRATGHGPRATGHGPRATGHGVLESEAGNSARSSRVPRTLIFCHRAVPSCRTRIYSGGDPDRCRSKRCTKIRVRPGLCLPALPRGAGKIRGPYRPNGRLSGCVRIGGNPDRAAGSCQAGRADLAAGIGSAGRSGWAVKSMCWRIFWSCPALLPALGARAGSGPEGPGPAWGAGPLGPADGFGVQGPPSAPWYSFGSIRQECEGPGCRRIPSGRRSAGYGRVRFLGTLWAAETGTNVPLWAIFGHVAGGENGYESAFVGDLWARWHSVEGGPAAQVGRTVPLWAISGTFAP